jgi:hypothetical protein
MEVGWHDWCHDLSSGDGVDTHQTMDQPRISHTTRQTQGATYLDTSHKSHRMLCQLSLHGALHNMCSAHNAYTNCQPAFCATQTLS